MLDTTVTRELICQLTEEELLERGDRMADAELRCEQLKNERKRLNAQIREQTDIRAELALVIENKRETRDIPCTWQADYELKIWRLMRSDSEDEIETRDMSEADLQGKMFADDNQADEAEVIKLEGKKRRRKKADGETKSAKKKSKKRKAS